MVRDVILADAERFVRPAPCNAAPGDMAAFEADMDCLCAPVGARLLRDAVFNASGELFDAHDVLECSFLDRERFEGRDRARYARRLAAAHAPGHVLEGECLWIADRHSHNYHHWLCDALPKLEAWLQRHRAATLAMPGRAFGQAFVRESLEAYRGQLRVVEPPSDDLPTCAGSLIVIDRTAPAAQHHDRLVAAVAARLRERYGSGVAPTGRRIHVSRARARMRRIVNEAELAPVFERHGFETVFAEELSLAEQVAMMAGTRVLVGAHGAGLTNMMFMPAGSTVLELRQLSGPPNCFFALAGASGHCYRYLACKPGGRPAHPHAADIGVDPDELDRSLAELPQ